MHLRRGALVIIATLTAAVAGEPNQPAKLSPELETVFGMALGAPPEFAASALLRIAPRVSDRQLRRDLIGMAFRLAAGSNNPVRLAAVPGLDPDTRQAFRASSGRVRLDALSLQSRAVRAMIPLDPARGRELFNQMRRDWPAQSSCDQSLLPDVSPYYDALALVIARGFSAKERASAEHLTFSAAELARITIAELAPAAAFLANLDGSRSSFEIASGAFAAKLESMPPDSRAFLFYSPSIEDAVAAVVARGRQLGAATQPLVEAYRKFLVAQLRGPRCADSGKASGKIVQIAAPTVLFGETIRGELPPLRATEQQPDRVEGEMKLDRFWQSEPAQNVYQACLKLRQSADGTNLTAAARRTPEWSRHLTDFLSLLANWRPGDEASESDYFHQKAIVYEALLELAPPGASSDAVIEAFTDFLKSSNLQQQNVVEWFWHARSTLDRVRPGQPEQYAKLLAAFRASGNIVLALEALLESVSPAVLPSLAEHNDPGTVALP